MFAIAMAPEEDGDIADEGDDDVPFNDADYPFGQPMDDNAMSVMDQQELASSNDTLYKSSMVEYRQHR